jgi:hypothetical protein
MPSEIHIFIGSTIRCNLQLQVRIFNFIIKLYAEEAVYLRPGSQSQWYGMTQLHPTRIF